MFTRILLLLACMAAFSISPPLSLAVAEEEAKPVNPFADKSRQRMNSIAEDLHKTANTYGPDSVILQTKLLIKCIAADAAGPSEVRVVGPSSSGGDYLRVEVATGLIFPADDSSPSSRVNRVWQKIAVPALAEMGSFNMEPGGLELIFAFGVQDLATLDLKRPDPTLPATDETVSIVFDAATLDDFAFDAITTDDLRKAVKVRYGEREIAGWEDD